MHLKQKRKHKSQINVLRKIVCKAKIDRIRSQQIRESDKLMSGWKGEGENVTNM